VQKETSLGAHRREAWEVLLQRSIAQNIKQGKEKARYAYDNVTG
jgi:hypothetical protein